MDSLLNLWLGASDAIHVVDAASVSLVREAVRAAGSAAGVERTALEGLVAAASELAHNQLAHAYDGHVAVVAIERGGVPGVEVIAADRGPGIVSPRRALLGEAKTSGSVGVGLSSVARFASELDFDVRIGEGACVRARTFAGPVAYRSEVAIVGRPHPGERVSGDHAAFVRRGDELVVTVVDGLGHGEPAREAANRAIDAFTAAGDASPARLLETADRALDGTRGVVMAAGRIDRASRAFEQASVGNVVTHLVTHGRPRSFGGSAFVLGARGGGRRPIIDERCPYAQGDVVLMYTDGLKSTVRLAEERALLREPPIVVAEELLSRYGRDTDDALVLVAR